jgi:hypothetical protein
MKRAWREDGERGESEKVIGCSLAGRCGVGVTGVFSLFGSLEGST